MPSDIAVSLKYTGAASKSSRILARKLFQTAYASLDLCLIVATMWFAASFFAARDPLVELLMVRLVLLLIIFTTAMLHALGKYAEGPIFCRKMHVRRVGMICMMGPIPGFAAVGLLIGGQIPVEWILGWYLASVAFLLASATLVRALVDLRFIADALVPRTVMVGATQVSPAEIDRLIRDRPLGRFLGFVDDRVSRAPISHFDLPNLGTTADLRQMVADGRVDHVVVAIPDSATERVSQIRNDLADLFIRVDLAKKTSDSPALVDHLDSLIDPPLDDWQLLAKSVLDRLIALGALIAFGPLLLAIAIAIKLESPGPVFFRQPRQGFNHRSIWIWKFRSMYRDAADITGARQTMRNDPRVTHVGRFIRRTSLDELPQLLNVLAGEMSIVGPRPHAWGTDLNGRRLDEVVEDYAARHRVKPGITGWAQVNGWRGEMTDERKVRERVAHDLWYIENWSIWLDVKIVIRTAFVMLTDDKAY